MSHIGGTAGPDKRTLRRELLAERSRLTSDDVSEAATALARRALELPELARARTVAAYVSVGAEPGTLALLDALRARGVRVLLPALLPDNDLDWGAYAGREALARVRHGGRMALSEPAGRGGGGGRRPGGRGRVGEAPAAGRPQQALAGGAGGGR
ncbi:5-formyltetrahydrofolate cyclo-ligase, partial [Streptomyces sp. NPDC056160]|uniref:5-formyltetrahydrofolate cyclo-ligase n=1 Tax=Streptomyces sp. NPDC056160 TaxID=3345731 RepID=UPI0035E2607F